MVLHIKTPGCARILIPKDSLATFTNYPTVTKDQVLEETVFMLFHSVVHACFQLVSIIARHDVVKGYVANSQK